MQRALEGHRRASEERTCFSARVVPLVLLPCAWAYPGDPVQSQVPTRPGLDPEKALTQYVYDTWTMADGLPHNHIKAIVQTRDGYLWLGTLMGLVRFDG